MNAERHPQFPVSILILETVWEQEEARLQADHDQHKAAIEASLQRIGAFLKGSKS